VETERGCVHKVISIAIGGPSYGFSGSEKNGRLFPLLKCRTFEV